MQVVHRIGILNAACSLRVGGRYCLVAEQQAARARVVRAEADTAGPGQLTGRVLPVFLSSC